MNFRDEIINFISKLSKVPKNEITMDTEIYDSDILSSLNLLELMSFIEKQYNIFIEPEELIETNFKDVKTLKCFVESKVGFVKI